MTEKIIPGPIFRTEAPTAPPEDMMPGEAGQYALGVKLRDIWRRGITPNQVGFRPSQQAAMPPMAAGEASVPPEGYRAMTVLPSGPATTPEVTKKPGGGGFVQFTPADASGEPKLRSTPTWGDIMAGVQEKGGFGNVGFRAASQTALLGATTEANQAKREFDAQAKTEELKNERATAEANYLKAKTGRMDDFLKMYPEPKVLQSSELGQAYGVDIGGESFVDKAGGPQEYTRITAYRDHVESNPNFMPELAGYPELRRRAAFMTARNMVMEDRRRAAQEAAGGKK